MERSRLPTRIMVCRKRPVVMLSFLARSSAGSKASRKIPAAAARAMVASRSRRMVPPASKAKPRSPAFCAPSTVRGPMVGRSARRDWPGLSAFTSTPPGPSRRNPPARASMASVPSIASTASTRPCWITQPCPTSTAPSARQTAMPRWMSARARSSGAGPAIRAAGGSSPPSTCCAPSTSKPSSASTFITARRIESSPLKAARPNRASSFTPAASGRSDRMDGRATVPASTSWRTPWPFSHSSMVAIRPQRKDRDA